MGKHGAGELNYSSDIDIVVFFDPEAGIVADPDEATDTYSRAWCGGWCGSCRSAPATAMCFAPICGLRPDPGSTPLAFPLDAALNYYESRGQNWERAAFIKARRRGWRYRRR
jgi:glutamate-ammonia-ligase adenylyltransferase